MLSDLAGNKARTDYAAERYRKFNLDGFKTDTHNAYTRGALEASSKIIKRKFEENDPVSRGYF